MTQKQILAVTSNLVFQICIMYTCYLKLFTKIGQIACALGLISSYALRPIEVIFCWCILEYLILLNIMHDIVLNLRIFKKSSLILMNFFLISKLFFYIVGQTGFFKPNCLQSWFLINDKKFFHFIYQKIHRVLNPFLFYFRIETFSAKAGIQD